MIERVQVGGVVMIPPPAPEGTAGLVGCERAAEDCCCGCSESVREEWFRSGEHQGLAEMCWWQHVDGIPQRCRGCGPAVIDMSSTSTHQSIDGASNAVPAAIPMPTTTVIQIE